MKRLVVVLAGISLFLVPPHRVALARAGSDQRDRAIAHLLNRIAFGPRAGDVEKVRAVGLKRHIDQQLHPEGVADPAIERRLSRLVTPGMSSREIAELFSPAARAARHSAANGSSAPPAPDRRVRAPTDVMIELAEQKLLRAVYSERQLQEVLVDFWFNHFNVDGRKGPDRFMLAAYERETIRPHVLGRFRDLLEATARSPAMLFYLDNWLSAAEHDNGLQGARRSRPQNRRGLNENYARELMELHTLGVDGGYTQPDVIEVARAFTGWTIDNPRQGGGFRFEPRLHDRGEKVVLGHRIKAGGGIEDGEQVLDILAAHPSTARFIATKLARRFVSDRPPAALVSRAAERFRATHGDLREVTRTILRSREFMSASTFTAKVKTPYEFVVSAVRASGAEIVDARALVRTLQQLGMPLYQCQPPTGYSDVAEPWLNTGALVSRMNFAAALAGNQLRGVSIADPASIRLAIDLSNPTRAAIANAATPAQALALSLGAPEFQRR